MKLGDVLRKERERKELSISDVAEKMGLSESEYEVFEAGESPMETWGPHLAHIAMTLETPTSRLLSETGHWRDCEAGQIGKLIMHHRNRREKSIDQMAEALDITADEYSEIEHGNSPLEVYGPFFLHFAEMIEQPVFNLFYPAGIPFAELEVDDYERFR